MACKSQNGLYNGKVAYKWQSLTEVLYTLEKLRRIEFLFSNFKRYRMHWRTV